MDRSQKRQITAALHEDLSATVCVVVTHQTGLSVAEVTQLRRQMRSAGARYRVTKNRLARRALEGTPFAALVPLFTGPTAIAYSNDPVAAAKAAVEYANRNNKLTVIGGGLSGQPLDAAGIRALATLPSLDELRSKIIGLLNAPATKLARLLQTPAGQLARVLAAHSEQAGSEQAGSEQAGSEQAGSEQASPEQASPEQASPEEAGPEEAGSEPAGAGDGA